MEQTYIIAQGKKAHGKYGFALWIPLEAKDHETVL
jgi:hypothetical protein